MVGAGVLTTSGYTVADIHSHSLALGLWFGAWSYRLNTIVPVVFAHMLNNTLALTQGRFGDSSPHTPPGAALAVYCGASCGGRPAYAGAARLPECRSRRERRRDGEARYRARGLWFWLARP